MCYKFDYFNKGVIMKKIALTWLISLVCGGAYAADWVAIGNGQDGYAYYVDFDYYKYDKKTNAADMWFKKERANGSTYFTQKKSLSRFYCDSKTYRTLSAITYLASGDVENTYRDNYLIPAETVFPDTTGELLWDVACGTPAKGLDFKYANLEDFSDYQEYQRASYAYLRMKPKPNIEFFGQLTPHVKIENYRNYDDYLKDVKTELDKLREQNIIKNYK